MKFWQMLCPILVLSTSVTAFADTVRTYAVTYTTKVGTTEKISTVNIDRTFNYENRFNSFIKKDDLKLSPGEVFIRFEEVACTSIAYCETSIRDTSDSVDLKFYYPYPTFYSSETSTASPQTIALWFENESDTFIHELLAQVVANGRFDVIDTITASLGKKSATIDDLILGTLVELVFEDRTGDFNLFGVLSSIQNADSVKVEILQAFFPLQYNAEQVLKVTQLLKTESSRVFALKMLEIIRKASPGYASSLASEFSL